MVKRIFWSQRFYEIFIPIITWLLITLPVWLSPFLPELVAYFIIIFNVYFFYKTLKTVILASIAYMRIKTATKIDWMASLKSIANWESPVHFVIVTNYKETYPKLKKTLEAIEKQTYSSTKIHLVLAMEDAEGSLAKQRAKLIAKSFKDSFAGIYTTYHVLLPGEEKGKASNEAHAARWISQKVRKMGIDSKNVIVTTSDADSIFDKNYFAYLAYSFLKDKNRLFHFYWAPLLLYSNYWKLNFFIRIQTTISSILRLAFLTEEHNLIQISTYSMNLWLLEQVGYWDVDIIPEDWHIFLQAFIKFGSIVETKPIYLITTGDGIVGKNLIDTLKSRYEQEKRWAWGVTDIPYACMHFIRARHISFSDKFFRLIGVLETHILWPTSFFLLTIGANIPALLNPYFRTTTLGFLLPKVAGGILTLTASFVIGIAYLDFQAKKRFLKKREDKKISQLLIQWVLFPVLAPIISAFLSSIPALESHTRMLFGKKIDYKVTKKV